MISYRSVVARRHSTPTFMFNATQEVEKMSKKLKRHIGIDLHTNSFTACFLLEGAEPETHTLPLQGGGLERFIEMLQPNDEVAVEATGNSRWFCEQVEGHVSRVVMIAPWKFEVIRRSVNKTDKNDAKAIAFFLSKDMLPAARVKSKLHAELASIIGTRDQLVKSRVSLLNKVHAMFNGHGIKIKKEVLTSKIGFERAVNSHEWSRVEQTELKVIAAQLDMIRENEKVLKAEITAAAKTLPGYENLISIKGIGPLSAAIFLVTIGDIKNFAKAGNLAAFLGITPRVSQSNDSQRVGPGLPSVVAKSPVPPWCSVRSLPCGTAPICATSTNASDPRAARARLLLPLLGSSSTQSSIPSGRAGCSRIFPISNLNLATNHRSSNLFSYSICCSVTSTQRIAPRVARLRFNRLVAETPNRILVQYLS